MNEKSKFFDPQPIVKALEQGETLSDIARRSGVSVDTVMRARDVANLSVKSLHAIANALGYDLEIKFANRKAATSAR